MTLLRTTPPLDATVNPEFTAAKRLRAFWRDMGAYAGRETRGLDVAAVRKKYAPGVTHWREATFAVPLNTPAASYERRRNEAVKTFMEASVAQGWRWAGGRIRVNPGIYPSHDPDGVPDLGAREFIIGAAFRWGGKAQRLEIDPAWLKPVRPEYPFK